MTSIDDTRKQLSGDQHIGEITTRVTSQYGPEVRSISKLIEYDDERTNRFQGLQLCDEGGRQIGTTDDTHIARAFADLYGQQPRLHGRVYTTFSIDLTTGTCRNDGLPVVSPLQDLSRGGYDFPPRLWRPS